MNETEANSLLHICRAAFSCHLLRAYGVHLDTFIQNKTVKTNDTHHNIKKSGGQA